MDIGTGYYAEMTIEQAKLYFRRKSAYVEQQVETIQHKLLPEKQKVRQIIVETLQKKIQEMSLSIQPQSSENATSWSYNCWYVIFVQQILFRLDFYVL